MIFSKTDLKNESSANECSLISVGRLLLLLLLFLLITRVVIIVVVVSAKASIEVRATEKD
jgi:hypothetical protein